LVKGLPFEYVVQILAEHVALGANTARSENLLDSKEMKPASS
jgi:hypothetical protein